MIQHRKLYLILVHFGLETSSVTDIDFFMWNMLTNNWKRWYQWRWSIKLKSMRKGFKFHRWSFGPCAHLVSYLKHLADNVDKCCSSGTTKRHFKSTILRRFEIVSASSVDALGQQSPLFHPSSLHPFHCKPPLYTNRQPLEVTVSGNGNVVFFRPVCNLKPLHGSYRPLYLFS